MNISNYGGASLIKLSNVIATSERNIRLGSTRTTSSEESEARTVKKFRDMGESDDDLQVTTLFSLPKLAHASGTLILQVPITAVYLLCRELLTFT